jgi:transposase-like protein
LVLKSTLEEAKMAHGNRKVDEEMVQGILLEGPAFLKEIVEWVLQELLEAEMTEHIEAAPYERAENRKGHRNGYKPRTLRRRVGTLKLAVPQDREGAFSTRLFCRYQRTEKALVLALMEMYVEGVSTRKVKEITEELCGTSFSKSLVSQLAGGLDSQLEAWRERRLEAQAYPYLFVDARYEKVRVSGRVVNQGVLLVLGVRDDGYREIVGVEVADTESEATYPGALPLLEAAGAYWCAAGRLGRARGPEGGRNPPLSGGYPPEMPGPLRQEPPGDGGPRQAQRALRRPTRCVRRTEQGGGPQARFGANYRKSRT